MKKWLLEVVFSYFLSIIQLKLQNTSEEINFEIYHPLKLTKLKIGISKIYQILLIIVIQFNCASYQ